MSFSKVICVVDEDVNVQDVGQVAWRLLANLDQKRDVSFVQGPIDELDHGADQALWGSKVCIDGTRKLREEGYMRDWPEPCRTTEAMAAHVEAIWPELGLAAAPAAGFSAPNGAIGPSVAARVADVVRDWLARARI